MKKITLLLFAFITSIWSVNAQSLINITTSGGSYGTEKWVSITTEADGAGTQVWGQGDGSYGNGAGLINEDISIAPGTYYVNCYDKYDDGWDGTLIAVTSYSNTIGDNGGVSPDDDNDVDSSAAWETPADELEASFVIVVPDPPSCSPVSGVTVAPVSGTDVTIAWTAGDSETGWSYEYGATGFTQGDGTSGTTSTTSVDISGLTPGSVYDIYIQANCTGEDSTWVMVTFTMPIAGDNIVTAVPITPSAAGTGCDTVGFTLNFSSDGTTDSGLDGSCNNSNTGLDQFFTWTATTDALLFNDAEPGNPGIVVRDLAGNEISCAETFAADDSILSGWEIGDDLIIQIYDYGTSVSDVAFCLEEFSMPETPNCAENLSPTDGATNVAIPQAVISISWDAPATGVAPTGYEVFLGTTSGALNSLGDTEETTVSITNLNYATTYYWKVVSKNGVSVAADCSESSFTTQSASVPFISSFENYPSGWFEAAGAYGSPAGTTSTFTQGDFGNDTENANGKSAKVNIYGTGTDEYLVSPILDLSSGTHYLNFDLALTAYNATTAATLGADDYLALLVTQDAGTTWQELTRWDSDSTLGNTGDPIDEIELTGYGAEVQFAFYAFSDTSNVDNDLFIDNFQITAVSLAPVTDPTEAAPTPPARETADVVSLFSDAYTDVTLTELPTDWSDVTTFEATTVASDNVWKLSGLEFLGMVTNYDTGIDVSSMEKLHIDYWVPTGVENELIVKIVNTIDGGEDVESLGTTVAGSWQSIDLDMTGFDGGNLANTEKITQILIDAVDRAATVYVDNFYFYKEPVVVTEPTEAAPTPPARETADVVSLFSDAYTDVTLTELPTDWSDVTTFEATTVASDNVWKLSGLEFLGMVTNYDTGIDVSSMEKLHIDYWVPTGVENELIVKIVNTIDGGEDVESLGTTVAGSWQSIDLDMTGFDGGNLANTEKITQILIDAVDRAATVYVDNFYFYKEPVVVTEPTEAAPTPPARETADVVSLFSDAYTDVTLTELPTDWSDVTTFEATTVASDNVWKLSGLEFLGMVTNYDTGIDVSSMEKLHIDYWVPTGVENELLVKIVNTVDGGEDVESLGTTVAGSWQSIDLDMTGFDGGNLANTEKITQILIDAVDRAATVYVDNFYFYKEPSTTSDIIFITELADPNDNAAARYVEIYNGGTSDVDLTGWTLRRYTNGNAEPQTTGEDLTPIGSLAPGAIAIIAANGTAFEAAFGMAADISAGTGGPADSNGDDQIYITDASDTIVDFFGVPGEDGSGTDHEFEDGRAERKASVTQGTATWDVNEWNIDNDAGAGDGALDVDGGFDPGVWIGADTSGVENESLITLNMYPNPASDVLNISSQSTINMVEIFNVLGQKVITMQVEDTSAEINVSNLNAGIYLIKYEINNSTSTKKFVKN